ncbi:MAG: lipopolysaccharide biosynthesis protein [Saprospiraceae bacterium]
MNFEITNVRALQGFQIMRQGAAILISILLAKSVLTSEEIGTFEMLTFIGTTVSFFWIAGLNQGVLPFFPKLNSTDQRPFIFNIFLLFCGVSIFVIVLLFLFENSIIQLLVGQESLPYIKWYSIYLLFFMPSFLVDYIYLVNNRAKEILTFGIVVFSLQIIVVILPLILGKGLLGSIQGLVGLGVFRFLWLVKVVADYGKIEWKKAIMSDYLKLSIPLILYALLSGFPTVFDSWVVGWFYDDKSTFAIFRYGARELPLAIALANALNMAMIPEIVQKNNANAFTNLKTKTLNLFHWLFPLSIVLMLTSSWWFPKVFNPDFSESASIFNVFLLVIISRLIFPQTILIALGKTKMVLYISILETILNIILSIIFVQYFGLIGIAFGTVLAYLFEKIAIAIYLSFQHGIAFSKYTPTGWFLFYSTLLISAYFFT